MTAHPVMDWAAFRAELDRWADAGLAATLWWRDDDAATAEPALDRLLALSDGHGVPVTIATIPARADHSLAGRLAAAPGAMPVQHGYAHRNHAAAGDPKSELGGERPADHVAADLAVGWTAMERLFGARTLPVMVPPWNRIAPHLVPWLPEMGYRGLSTFGPRGRAQPVARLTQVNTHADLIDWPGHRGFAGDDRVLGALGNHLADRREGRADSGEPTGLLSHHLAHDEGCWAFLDRLFGETGGHPAVRWLDAATVFGLGAEVPA